MIPSFEAMHPGTKKLCLMSLWIIAKIKTDESVTFCHPTPQLHNDIHTPLLQNTFTPAKKPESDMSSVKIEALIAALKSYVSCEISMINAKLTSFCEHINKTSNLNHRKDEYLESL